MKKNIVLVTCALSMLFTASAWGAQIPKEFDWAKEAVEYCLDKEILAGVGEGNLLLEGNLTREQMAKLLVEAFGKLPEPESMVKDTEESQEDKTEEIKEEKEPEPTFSDVGKDRWSYKYVEVFKDYMKVKKDKFNPEEKVTREEFAGALVMMAGYKDTNVLNRDILEDNFDDYKEVSDTYKNLLCIAVERGYMKGKGDNIAPKALLTRAETCMFIYRVLESKAGNIELDLGVKKTQTPLLDKPAATLEQAKAWAKSRGAHERYIAIADLYWKYGEITGIRPDILYAQAAKETGFGKYTGNVIPEQNNWAGIKTAKATGDTTYDHESFATPEDGVRAHFNHMSAYIGTEPVGEPHGRYHSVKSIAWAGTVVNLEELGGKWCPDLYYGYSINYNYLKPMQEIEVEVKETEDDIG